MDAIVPNPAAALLFFIRIMVSPLISSLSLPLIIGPHDPTGAACLPADAVVCAGRGLHAGSVITALHIQDTSGVESILRLAPEHIDDQARCLLEDMAIGAIKIGPQYDPETIAVLAQVAADYSALPLVLQLSNPPAVPDLLDLDADDTLGAALDLLVPQASVVIVDPGQAEHWAQQGLLSATRAADPLDALLELGANTVLSCRPAAHPGFQLALRSAPHSERHWPWPASQVRPDGRDGLLATLLVCGLAQGQAVADACQQAVETATGMMAHTLHPGMGRHILRYLP
ncbi:bifunctional hydroxymethylpyrimidine kinase/phosphomethylpyrimidine kinase [Castellaniella hirudinis]|uniref:bifunctional hydroxymethylpyrimidine kinase/phosphomethylpyrimidine kinase n=1 Tax=Castellaniella hirudinis TaxID=1144617 RepID=UPI0039C2CD47